MTSAFDKRCDLPEANDDDGKAQGGCPKPSQDRGLKAKKMTVTPQHRRGRQSWKDSPKAKTIAGTISLLLGVGWIVMLVFAVLSLL